MDVKQGDAAGPDWDRAGVLSIVVQGGVSRGNLVETATNCRHWRTVFPAAQIILAMSSTDVLAGETADGVYGEVGLVPAARLDGQMRGALAILRDSCDVICEGEAATPLPPIKSDSPKMNNTNLQRAAARAGLAQAGGRYVLRIRSDMVFADRRFLAEHAAGMAVPRGRAAALRERVLISWLFTLNPFTNERMPLHLSDWFHFGLLEDVRRIWSGPAMTLRDATYYLTEPHEAGSNLAERLFRTRLAVEQHLLLEVAEAAVPGFRLAFHNDGRSAEESLDVLVDNFVLSDLEAVGFVFEKYAGELLDYRKRLDCLTPGDWWAMVGARDVPHAATLAAKVAAFRDEGAFEHAAPFPRVYEAAWLAVRDGQLLNRVVVNGSRRGLLFAGPSVTVPAGRYRAVVDCATLEGPGSVVLRVEFNSGDTVLGERVIDVGADGGAVLEVLFDVAVDRADEVEVLLAFEELRAIAVRRVLIERRTEPCVAVGTYQRAAERVIPLARLKTRDGRRVAGGIAAAGVDGTLFYGPYLPISRGRYVARVAVEGVAGSGRVTLTAVVAGVRVATAAFPVVEGQAPKLELAFDVQCERAEVMEIVGRVTGLTAITVTGLVIGDRGGEPVVTAGRGKWWGRSGRG